MLQVHLIYQRIQSKLNATAKIGNISISGKVKVVVENMYYSVSLKSYYLPFTEIHYTLCFNEYT